MSDATKRNDTTKRGSEPGAGGADETLHLLAEEFSVSKQERETGRVRVSTETHEREALVDEDLAHHQVEIERIPVGRRVETVPDVRQEGDTTVVPVVEEILHIERQLMLKEEVRIRRVSTTERHQEKVMLRHQEAVVTRRSSGTPGDPPGAEENSKKLKSLTDRKG